MKKKALVGTYFRISLSSGKIVYARLIDEFLFAFYLLEDDVQGNEEIRSAVQNTKPVFIIYVHKYVFSKSSWEKIFYEPVEELVKQNLPFFFRQDRSDKQKCVLVNNVPGFKQAVHPIDCVNLEREAVWDFENVEKRLQDLIDNKPNLEFERMRVKL